MSGIAEISIKIAPSMIGLLPIFRPLAKRSVVSHNASQKLHPRRCLRARKPRSTNSITDSASVGKSRQGGLTSRQVRAAALSHLVQGVDLDHPEDARYGKEDLSDVLLYAAAHKTTPEQAGEALKQSPHANTVRGAIAPLPLEKLEAELNQVLARTFPPKLLRRPLEIAVDLVLIPYHGKAQPGEEDFLIQEPARQGTTTFFAYASIYVIKKNKRFTLALTVVRRGDGMVGVLRRLLARFFRLGGRLCCLYLDRQFYTVEVLRFLIEEQDPPFAMAAQKRGQAGGIKGLIAREGSRAVPLHREQRQVWTDQRPGRYRGQISPGALGQARARVLCLRCPSLSVRDQLTLQIPAALRDRKRSPRMAPRTSPHGLAPRQPALAAGRNCGAVAQPMGVLQVDCRQLATPRRTVGIPSAVPIPANAAFPGKSDRRSTWRCRSSRYSYTLLRLSL